MKKCPACGSKRIFCNEKEEWHCKKCHYINKKVSKEDIQIK